MGRLRFPGLDPNLRYRVTPLMLESAPSGLRPPLWWGVTIAGKYEARAAGTTITSRVDGTVPEIELPGAVLSNLGLPRRRSTRNTRCSTTSRQPPEHETRRSAFPITSGGGAGPSPTVSIHPSADGLIAATWRRRAAGSTTTRRREPVGAAAGLEPGPLRLVGTALRRSPSTAEEIWTVVGENIVVGQDGDGLGVRLPGGGVAGSSRPAGQTPGRADVLRAAVQHLDRDALSTHPDRVLGYARGLLDAGFPPGVLMIDDQWSMDYGNWRFDRARFPDPAEMMPRAPRPGASR